MDLELTRHVLRAVWAVSPNARFDRSRFAVGRGRIGGILASLRALVAARSYGPFAHYLATLPPLDDASTHKLDIRETVCGTCRSGAINVGSSRRTEKGWKVDMGSVFSCDSGPGEAPGIAVATTQATDPAVWLAVESR